MEARGLVQGVGFRPFVYRLACELGLAGEVRNHSGGVSMVVEGEPRLLDCFEQRLRAELPPPGRIETLASECLPPAGRDGFAIVASEARQGA
ncbi:MAG: acylphosphatase, partial [Armatimonadetes bacterium]|nr:acylphosphatase [Armatimonadota bacterium]